MCAVCIVPALIALGTFAETFPIFFLCSAGYLVRRGSTTSGHLGLSSQSYKVSMASILKIGDSWRVQIRRKGYRSISQTFATDTLAHEWAEKIEAELRSGGRIAHLSTVIDEYLHDAAEMGATKVNVLGHLRAGLGSIRTDKLTAADITKYVLNRGYGPATAQSEVSILGTLLKAARLLMGYKVPEVIDDAREMLKLKGKLKKSNERDRRPTAEELDQICQWFDLHSTMPMRDIVWFSIHSAMRASEVTRIQWADYDPHEKTVIIRDRKDPRKKIGNHQVVPLLDEAIEIIERQPRTSEYIFPYNEATFSSIFPRACKTLGIVNLRWHDLRHEGASRLFERGYSIPEVALFTGHKDWTMLRRYTHLKASKLRRLPLPALAA